MSEAANLVFQWIFVLNSVKHKFFPACIVKGFGEKCKHKELALNFIQKQNFSLKNHFPVIIVE